MKVTIRDQTWALRFLPGNKMPWDFERKRKVEGWCDLDKREILIWDKLKGEDRLRVILHELRHAEQPDLDEEIVDHISTDSARILTRLGYACES